MPEYKHSTAAPANKMRPIHTDEVLREDYPMLLQDRCPGLVST